MAKPKIALRLGEISPEEKVRFATVVHGNMASNAASFPTPNPALAALNSAQSNLNTRLKAIAAAEANLEADRSQAKLDETALDGLLTQMASYVENVANGNAATIQLAGFELAGEPVPIGPLPPPENLQGSTADIEGNVNLKWNRVRGARSYFVECATNPNGPWTQVDVTTRVSAVAAGLTSGTKYWFRVRALGAAGFSGWSDSTQKMAA
jgi:hypothetical protein